MGRAILILSPFAALFWWLLATISFPAMLALLVLIYLVLILMALTLESRDANN